MLTASDPFLRLKAKNECVLHLWWGKSEGVGVGVGVGVSGGGANQDVTRRRTVYAR